MNPSRQEVGRTLRSGSSVTATLRMNAAGTLYISDDMRLSELLALFKAFADRKNNKNVLLFLHIDDTIAGGKALDMVVEQLSWIYPFRITVYANGEKLEYLKTKNPPFALALEGSGPATPVAAQKSDGFVGSFKKTIGTRYRRMRYLTFLWLLDKFESRARVFFTFHTRPMYASQITDAADALRNPPSCAIVMQGLVLTKHNFTLETVRIYKKLYPYATVIISTWDTEDGARLEELRTEGADIVLNSKPAYNGPFNINFQLTSAHSGMRRAQELGCTWALKTRTDQRMYNKNILESMTNLLNYFTPSERSHQRKRLLFVHGGNKYQPYMLPDVFVFGDTSDMLEYWGAPLIERGSEYTLFLPEIYLATTFLKKKGWALDWTVSHMWDIQRECFVAIDWHDVELYWYKYSRYREYMDRKNYKRRIPNMDQVSFYDWFNIFSNKDNKQLLPEHDVFFRELPPERKE